MSHNLPLLVVSEDNPLFQMSERWGKGRSNIAYISMLQSVYGGNIVRYIYLKKVLDPLKYGGSNAIAFIDCDRRAPICSTRRPLSGNNYSVRTISQLVPYRIRVALFEGETKLYQIIWSWEREEGQIILFFSSS